MKKLIDFEESTVKEIQKHADEKHRKNFTAAVNELCVNQLKQLKKVSKNERES